MISRKIGAHRGQIKWQIVSSHVGGTLGWGFVPASIRWLGMLLDPNDRIVLGRTLITPSSSNPFTLDTIAPPLPRAPGLTYNPNTFQDSKRRGQPRCLCSSRPT